MNPLYFRFPDICAYTAAPGTFIPGEPSVNVKSLFKSDGFVDGRPCKTPSKSQLPAPEEYASTFPIIILADGFFSKKKKNTTQEKKKNKSDD